MSIAMLPARIPWRQPPTDHPMEVLDRLLDRGVVVFLRETGEAPRDDSGSPRPSPRARRARPARRRRPPRGQWALDRLDRATRCLAAVTAVLREAPNAERDRVLAAGEGVESALVTATAALRSRLSAGTCPASKGLHAWLH